MNLKIKSQEFKRDQRKKKKNEATTSAVSTNFESTSERKCPSCLKFFLRKGSLARHIGCKTCKRSEDVRKKYDKIEATLKAHATRIAAGTSNLLNEEKITKVTSTDETPNLWEEWVKGSARKVSANSKRKNQRFS